MVGNMYEWVADWGQLSTNCAPSLFDTDDTNCMAGASDALGPGAPLRGGDDTGGAGAGVFALLGGNQVWFTIPAGFRCGR
jgi:hypothetical protein